MRARYLRSAWLVLSVCLAGPVGAAPAHTAQHLVDEKAAIGRVLDLENERLALMPAVAAWKWQHHASVTDRDREQDVVRHALRLATPLGLSAAGVSRLFRLQIRLASQAETNLQQRWRAHGFSYSGTAPNLSLQLRPHLDRLTAQLLQALYLAVPLPDPAVDTAYARRAAKRLRDPQWTEQGRAQLLAALAAVRRDAAPPAARIAASGILRVGTTGDYAPYSIETDGRLRGADIELALSLARTLGVKPVFVRTTWPSLLHDLAAGRFDLAMSGISVTAARAAAGTFSMAYGSGGKTLIARCSDASRFTGLAAVDRPDVRVIVNPGGTNEQFVRAHLHHAQIVVFPDNRAIFDQILAGRADVMITDNVEAALQTHLHPRLCRTLAGTLTHSTKAILMPRNAPRLVAAVNGWLLGALTANEPARDLRTAIEQAARR